MAGGSPERTVNPKRKRTLGATSAVAWSISTGFEDVPTEDRLLNVERSRSPMEAPLIGSSDRISQLAHVESHRCDGVRHFDFNLRQIRQR